MIEGHTLLPGSVLSCTGTSISLDSTGMAHVVRSKTFHVNQPPTATSDKNYPLITAPPTHGLVIAGHYLPPGEIVTVSSTKLSPESDRLYHVVRGRARWFATETTSMRSLDPALTSTIMKEFLEDGREAG